jgi:hypothetical protein
VRKAVKDLHSQAELSRNLGDGRNAEQGAAIEAATAQSVGGSMAPVNNTEINRERFAFYASRVGGRPCAWARRYAPLPTLRLLYPRSRYSLRGDVRLPEVLVAVSTSRLSCKRAGKTRTFMPVWDSSGESRASGGAFEPLVFEPASTLVESFACGSVQKAVAQPKFDGIAETHPFVPGAVRARRRAQRVCPGWIKKLFE